MNENYSMPPVPQPEPPREPWLLRNKPGAIGLGLQLLALPLLVILPEAAFLAGAAGFLLCIAGLFIKPRLLPTLGVLIGLAVSGVFLIDPQNPWKMKRWSSKWWMETAASTKPPTPLG